MKITFWIRKMLTKLLKSLLSFASTRFDAEISKMLTFKIGYKKTRYKNVKVNKGWCVRKILSFFWSVFTAPHLSIRCLKFYPLYAFFFLFSFCFFFNFFSYIILRIEKFFKKVLLKYSQCENFLNNFKFLR